MELSLTVTTYSIALYLFVFTSACKKLCGGTPGCFLKLNAKMSGVGLKLSDNSQFWCTAKYLKLLHHESYD